MSSTLEEKSVLPKSPSDPPRPVKSNRSTAMPASVRASLMKVAALLSFEQVKQCAKSAYARGGTPDGMSSRAASACPVALGNETAWLDRPMDDSCASKETR